MTDQESPKAKKNKPKRTRKQKLIRLAIFLVYLSVLLEIGTRAYWRLAEDVPIFQGRQILRRFYPHLYDTGVLEADLRRDDGHLDVLMLGGSVLEDRFSTIRAELQAQLAERTGRSVRVFNLGRRGHTSRDSLFRYRELADKPFDLVLLYHGINEVRMNNCPRSMFREDYTHVAWYVQIERFYAHKEIDFLTFPYTIEYTVIGVLGSRRLEFYLHRHKPKPQWVEMGAEIKTDKALRANVQGILDLARRKGEPVLLMTFATHVPPDYSLEKFRAKSLDYGVHHLPLEVWGKPANVIRTLAAHNAVIADLAAGDDNTLFVDQRKLMPKGKKYFNDPCHLTEAGSKAYVANIVAAICRRWRKDGTLPAGGR